MPDTYWGHPVAEDGTILDWPVGNHPPDGEPVKVLDARDESWYFGHTVFPDGSVWPWIRLKETA